MAQDRLRQVELDLEEASRSLRRARSQVQLAREQLEEVEDRHWALLCMYNPDQAGEAVAEALQEFQEQEAAARLDSSSFDENTIIAPIPINNAESSRVQSDRKRMPTDEESGSFRTS